MKKAIILLSGGIDSATVLSIAIKEGYECYPISFNYGQRHIVELEFAKGIAADMDCASRHLIVNLDIAKLGGSALTDTSIAVPKTGLATDVIPVTYVPARNTIFLSYALGYAEVTGATTIFYGANAIDFSNYPDCRPEFLDAFAKVANLGTKAAAEGVKIEIKAPLIKMSKAEIMKLALTNGIALESTISCYDPLPDGKPCKSCDACVLRIKGLVEAGISDNNYM